MSQRKKRLWRECEGNLNVEDFVRDVEEDKERQALYRRVKETSMVFEYRVVFT